MLTSLPHTFRREILILVYIQLIVSAHMQHDDIVNSHKITNLRTVHTVVCRFGMYIYELQHNGYICGAMQP